MQETWQHYFKAEIRNRGLSDFQKGLVTISNASDTQIQAFVKGGSNPKVKFNSASIDADLFLASCTCPKGTQGLFCKHIWSVLLKVNEKHQDFLDSKSKIELKTETSKAAPKQNDKQTEFKKLQSLKQKEWLKKKRIEVKTKKLLASGKSSDAPQFPVEVQEALVFFSENGFEIDDPYDEEFIKKAMKQLSRVFHPDRGGSHLESVALNANYECLISYFHK